MILTCNSCGKKFVVPDSAITASGRMVQCGSCGNKWKQFPLEEAEKTQSIARPKKVVSRLQPVPQKIQKPKKVKKKATKKVREISLYSPEYLAKKHGIQINDTQTVKNISKKEKGKVSFGFYNSLILFIFLGIWISRSFEINTLVLIDFYIKEFFFNLNLIVSDLAKIIYNILN